MILINVRVRPGAKKTRFIDVSAGIYKFDLAAPAEGGKANKELIKFLAKRLHLKQKQVVIKIGNTSRNKSIVIEGFNTDQLSEVKNKLL